MLFPGTRGARNGPGPGIPPEAADWEGPLAWEGLEGEVVRREQARVLVPTLGVEESGLVSSGPQYSMPQFPHLGEGLACGSTWHTLNA